MDSRQWRNITGLSLLTAVLYNLGFLSPFFAVPLQFSASRKNKGSYLLSSLIAVLFILLFRTVVLSSLGAAGFILLDGIVLLLTVAGLYFCNFELKFLSLPERLGAVTLAAGLLILTTIPFADGVKEEIVLSLERIAALSMGLDPSAGGSEANQAAVETLYLIVRDTIGSTGLVWYFYFLAFSYYLGKRLESRNLPDQDTERKEEWLLPEYWVWLLFIPLTLFLLDKLFAARGMIILSELPYYGVSNLLLIAAIAYGLRGLGMAGHFLKERGMNERHKRFGLFILTFMFFMPGVNLVLLILIAGLGVSELWVNYRIFDKE